MYKKAAALDFFVFYEKEKKMRTHQFLTSMIYYVSLIQIPYYPENKPRFGVKNSSKIPKTPKKSRNFGEEIFQIPYYPVNNLGLFQIIFSKLPYF